MKINTIDNLNFNAKIYIHAKQNKENIYLYNNVLNIINKYRLPGIWNNEGISLPSVCQKAIGELKELGIKFERLA